MKSRCIITHHSSPSHLPTKNSMFQASSATCSKVKLASSAARMAWTPAASAAASAASVVKGKSQLVSFGTLKHPQILTHDCCWVDPCRSSINLPIHLYIGTAIVKKVCYCLRKHRRPGSPSFRLPSWQFLTCTRSRLCSEASLAAARPPKAAASWEAQAISNQISTPSGWIPL